MPTTGELLDALFDLKHDLGKYLFLPLGMLPREAPLTEVIAAARKGLLQTRIAGDLSRDVADLWREFTDAWADGLSRFDAFERLSRAVDGARAWQNRLTTESPAFSRDELESDFKAVGQAIGALIEEVRGE